MILKFKSNNFIANNGDVHRHEEGWCWVDDVARLQIVESVNIPGYVALPLTENSNARDSYLNPERHFAESYWVGVNPNDYNENAAKDELQRDPLYTMCYVWKRNGKIDLLAIGFLAEVYLLNDEGKTIDHVVNSSW